MASVQVSLAEFLEGSACENLDESEPGETDEVPPEIARCNNFRDDVDYTQTVFASEHGSCYHGIQYEQICACPNTCGTKVTLAEAVREGYTACGNCESIDVRKEKMRACGTRPSRALAQSNVEVILYE